MNVLIENHMTWVMKVDPTFKPFLNGLMSVEKNVIVNFGRTEYGRDCIAYLKWRDPDTGKFWNVGNVYDNQAEMKSFVTHLDMCITKAKEKAAYESVTIDVSGLLLPIPNGFGTCHPRREYPEDIVAMLAKLRSDRRNYLAKCEQVEATLIRIIKENNLLEGSDVYSS